MQVSKLVDAISEDNIQCHEIAAGEGKKMAAHCPPTGDVHSPINPAMEALDSSDGGCSPRIATMLPSNCMSVGLGEEL